MAPAQSSLASSAEPNHSVTISLPVPHLLRPGESLTFVDLPGLNEKYEPFPLTQDQNINKNFPTFDPANTEFKTLYRCGDALTSDFVPTGSLETDMAECLAHPGCTSLYCLVYQPVGSNDTPKVRIYRATTFYRPNGEVVNAESTTYDSLVTDWFRFRSSPSAQLWQKDINAMICQHGEQAPRNYKRVMLGITAEPIWQNRFGGEDPWKAPRIPAVEQAVEKLATVIDRQALEAMNGGLPADEKIERCIICRVDLADEPDLADKIVLLPCSKQHPVCLPCLCPWIQHCTLQKVRCPLCNRQLANAQLIAQHAPNALDIDAPIFTNDPMYSEWENFERSCADLDRELVKNNESTRLFIHAGLLAFAWSIVVHTAPAPHDESWHLVQTNLPDYTLLQQAFHQTINDHDGMTLPIADFLNILNITLQATFRQELMRTGAHTLYSSDALKYVLSGEIDVPMRPAFKLFVEKSFNRVLRFVLVRKCTEEGHCEGVKAKGALHCHEHGDRIFCRIT